MESRIITSIFCTLFSFTGITAAWSFGNLLGCAAWVAYFSILYFWIKNNRAPVPLVVIGTVLGFASIGNILFFGLLFTFPGVCLMTYIFFRSIISESENTQQKCI